MSSNVNRNRQGLMSIIVTFGMVAAIFYTGFRVGFYSQYHKRFYDGIRRKIVQYNNDGKILQTWYGADITVLSESENGIYFIDDGKRYIIKGGIIVVEELEVSKNNSWNN